MQRERKELEHESGMPVVWINFEGGFPSQFKRRFSNLLSDLHPTLSGIRVSPCGRGDGREEVERVMEELRREGCEVMRLSETKDVSDRERIEEGRRRVSNFQDEARKKKDRPPFLLSLQLDGVRSVLLEERDHLFSTRTPDPVRGGKDSKHTITTKQTNHTNERQVPLSCLEGHYPPPLSNILSLQTNCWSLLLSLKEPLSSLVEEATRRGWSVVVSCTNPICLGEHGCYEVGPWEGCCLSFHWTTDLTTRDDRSDSTFVPIETSLTGAVKEGHNTTTGEGFARKVVMLGERTYSLVTLSSGERRAFWLEQDPEERDDLSESSVGKTLPYPPPPPESTLPPPLNPPPPESTLRAESSSIPPSTSSSILHMRLLTPKRREGGEGYEKRKGVIKEEKRSAERTSREVKHASTTLQPSPPKSVGCQVRLSVSHKSTQFPEPPARQPISPSSQTTPSRERPSLSYPPNSQPPPPLHPQPSHSSRSRRLTERQAVSLLEARR